MAATGVLLMAPSQFVGPGQPPAADVVEGPPRDARLGAGGAEVEDGVPGLRFDELADQLAAFVLRLEQSFLPRS